MSEHSAEKDAGQHEFRWATGTTIGCTCGWVGEPPGFIPAKSPEREFQEHVASRAAEVKAEALREFADFIVGPTVPGLDDDTLLEVYLEAHARADQITHPPAEREEIAMPKNELVTALTDAIREEIDLGGDAESITTTVLSSEWAAGVVADARASGMRTLGGQFQQRGLEEAARVAFDAAECDHGDSVWTLHRSTDYLARRSLEAHLRHEHTRALPSEVQCECPTDDYCPRCHPRWYAKWRAECVLPPDGGDA